MSNLRARNGVKVTLSRVVMLTTFLLVLAWGAPAGATLAGDTVTIGVTCTTQTALSWFNALKAANAAFVFLIFFNLYGLAYRYLLNLDLFRIKHYTLLPLFLLLAVYAAGFIVRWNDTVTMTLWKNLILVCSLLVIFNLFLIIPAEWQKWKSNTTQMVPIDRMHQRLTRNPRTYITLSWTSSGDSRECGITGSIRR